jgi:hypothetical protein
MLVHGKYQLEMEDGIIHVYPVGGFNEFGIRKLHEDILELAPPNEPWALIEHPRSEAGLTPAAAAELAANYQKLSRIGCVAIGLEVNYLWQKVITEALGNAISIPVVMGKIRGEIEIKIQAYLKES